MSRLYDWADCQDEPEVLWQILRDECPWGFASQV